MPNHPHEIVNGHGYWLIFSPSPSDQYKMIARGATENWKNVIEYEHVKNNTEKCRIALCRPFVTPTDFKIVLSPNMYAQFCDWDAGENLPTVTSYSSHLEAALQKGTTTDTGYHDGLAGVVINPSLVGCAFRLYVRPDYIKTGLAFNLAGCGSQENSPLPRNHLYFGVPT